MHRHRNRPTALLLALIAVLLGVRARADESIAGFAYRRAGEVFEYHSPDVDVTRGLLVRCIDANRPIEWDTAPAPTPGAGDSVSFVWLFALQVNPAGHRFEMRINGEKWLEFRNPAGADTRDWTIPGAHNSSLRFRATMVDRFGDLMGYAMLRVPRAALTPGEPLHIAVSGETAASRAWYITYMAPVAERATLNIPPALVHNAGGGPDERPIHISIVHLGEKQDVTLRPSFGPEEKHTLDFGINRFELRLPEVDAPRDLTIEVVSDSPDKKGRPLHTLTGSIAPVRHWFIDLVQHAHTDVGYSRPQTEILAEHIRYIDTALDLCDKTDSEPDDAKFRWTCEGSWAVREFIRTRPPSQVERLRARAVEGRIEATAMFLNMSELMDEPGYASFLEPIAELRAAGLPVTTAMQDDVNGIAWSLADEFPRLGIKYLVMGQHGHRALVPFSIPTAFWWQSPGGWSAGGGDQAPRTLAFRADHYHTGNFWEVHTGRVERVEDELLRYLTRLEKSRYPFDHIAVQHSGYHIDNSPPSSAASQLVRDWNKKYAWPHLRCALAREFPQWVAEHQAKEIPSLPLAWTDWWTDGFGSAARESAAARTTEGRLIADESLLAMQTLAGQPTTPTLQRMSAGIHDDLNFWAEHTLGDSESIRQPLAEQSQVQWDAKAAYAWTAAKNEASLGEAALGRLRPLIPPADVPTLIVANTLGFPRSGLVEFNADHELLSSDGHWRIVDDKGEALPVRPVTSRMDGGIWAVWVKDIPAFGWRQFRILPASAQPEAPAAPASHDSNRLENAWFSITVDPRTGAIASLIDKETGKELVDQKSEYQLGQVIHESLGNREQLEGFMLDSFSRTKMTDPVIEGVTPGPIWDALSIRAEIPGCQSPGGVRSEIRLFHDDKRIELHYTLQKRRVYDPEAIYVAFPCPGSAAEGGDARVIYETIGATVNPATDILPGAASDWQTAQTFTAVQWPTGTRAGEQLVISTNEIPLVQIGGINLGKFQRRKKFDRPQVFSWVMNNYWTTNFCAAQEGEFRFTYALACPHDASRTSAARFGWSQRIPLLARLCPASPSSAAKDQPAPEPRSFLTIDAANVMLLAARPATNGPGIILHLREIEGEPTRIDVSKWQINGRPVAVTEVNAIQQPLATPAREDPEAFTPYQSKFLLLQSREQ
jgi:hypothetical protein